ncbi:MAG: hypothetical protein KDI36_19685, partial [Pseudomonadales bacterium]|nr:hypothetical protein [Pseudomonadales bacterium]
VWLWPPVMLLAIAAIGRLIAWIVHDATLAIDLIMPEVVIAGLLLILMRFLESTAKETSA